MGLDRKNINFLNLFQGPNMLLAGMDLNQLESEHAAILKRALMDSYLMLMKEEYTYEQISAQARILEEALKGTEHLKQKESHHE